jgi:hypothetical protein
VDGDVSLGYRRQNVIRRGERRGQANDDERGRNRPRRSITLHDATSIIHSQGESGPLCLELTANQGPNCRAGDLKIAALLLHWFVRSQLEAICAHHDRIRTALVKLPARGAGTLSGKPSALHRNHADHASLRFILAATSPAIVVMATIERQHHAPAAACLVAKPKALGSWPKENQDRLLA